MNKVVIFNAHVATVDKDSTEYRRGYVAIEGNKIVDLGEGEPPRTEDQHNTRYIDAANCLITPGLVNTHHHFYQGLTRGHGVNSGLFDWLTELYPIWVNMDETMVNVAVKEGLSSLARSGCTTTSDHHYVYPQRGGDLFAAAIEGAKDVGLRFHPTRGSMDLGKKQGGLPPDDVVESIDTIMKQTEDAIVSYHDPASDAMIRVGVSPCSPFSVSRALMEESQRLARAHGVLLHTHLAETLDEEDYCRHHFGCSPLEYAEKMGWLGEDVWFAHGVHFSKEDIALLGSSRTGIAHCPSSNGRLGAGIAPVRALLDAGVRVGLAVDSPACNERESLSSELRQTALFARARDGAEAMKAGDALRIATMGGAEILGRSAELGSLEVGKLADIAVWEFDEITRERSLDPVDALVLGDLGSVRNLFVNGREIIRDSEVITADQLALVKEVKTMHASLLKSSSNEGVLRV